jgi:hypothetical protein
MGLLRPKRKRKHQKYLTDVVADVLGSAMRTDLDRAVLTVLRHDGGWAVEHEGEHYGHSGDKEVAKACAHKMARQMQDGGKPCQVRVSGEHGFFAAR